MAEKKPRKTRKPKPKQKQKQRQQQIVKVNVQSAGGGGGTSVPTTMPTTFRDTSGEAGQIASLVSLVKQANAKAERDLEGIRREIAAGKTPTIKERERAVRDAGTAMEDVVDAVFNKPNTEAKGIVERAVGDIERKVRADKGKPRGSYKEKHMQEGIMAGYEGARALSEQVPEPKGNPPKWEE
jgi:hypothetical protein